MKNTIALAFAATMMAGGAQAVTFTDLPTGGLFGSTVFVGAEATITSFGSDLFFGGADGRPNSFCAISSGCAADMEIDFNDDVMDLTFSTGGFNTGDIVTVSAFDAADSLLGSIVVASDTLVDFSGFGSISRLFFDDESSGAGFGYDEFEWNPTSTVPLPAGLPLLLAGLGGVAALRRRKKS